MKFKIFIILHKSIGTFITLYNTCNIIVENGKHRIE